MSNNRSMNNTKAHAIKFIVGVVLITAGILLAIFYTVPQEAMQALPFTLIAIGFIGFVGGVCGFLTVRGTKIDQNMAKQIKVHENDERNIMIEKKATSTTDAIISPLLFAFLIFLAVMDVQLLVICVFAGIILLRWFLAVYLLQRYNKKL